MAYKQNPGRSPLLKTGRDIPLNFLQNSPLNKLTAAQIAAQKAADEFDWDKGEVGNTDETITKTSETEVMPIDKTASGGRSTFSTNIGDYALNTQGRKDEYTKRGWAQDDTTKITPTSGGAQDDTTKITPTSGGKSAKITKGKDLVTAGKATKKEGRQLKREGRRDDRGEKRQVRKDYRQAKSDIKTGERTEWADITKPESDSGLSSYKIKGKVKLDRKAIRKQARETAAEKAAKRAKK